MQFLNYVNSHGLAASATTFGLSLILTNIPFLVQKFVQLPWVIWLIKKDPDAAELLVAELKKDVDAVAETAKASDAQAPKAG